LGDAPERLGELALHLLGGRCGGGSAAGRLPLNLLRRGAGREHLHLARRVTVHRDASREMQVLSTGATAKQVQRQAAGGAPPPAAPAEEVQSQLAEALGRIAE